MRTLTGEHSPSETESKPRSQAGHFNVCYYQDWSIFSKWLGVVIGIHTNYLLTVFHMLPLEWLMKTSHSYNRRITPTSNFGIIRIGPMQQEIAWPTLMRSLQHLICNREKLTQQMESMLLCYILNMKMVPSLTVQALDCIFWK